MDGGTVQLVCTGIAAGNPRCALDSLLGLWFWPLLSFGGGAGVVYWQVRKKSA